MNLNDIIRMNQKLIYNIAYRFKQGDVDDLFQVGCIGLIKAYNNYDVSLGVKFTTYAYPYIVGEIYNYLNANQPLKMNHNLVKLAKNIKKAEDFLSQKLYRVPTDLEIANFLEIDLLKLEEIKNMLSVESLDYTYENNTLLDTLVIDTLDKDTLIALKDAMSYLTEDERKLIAKRYFYNMSQDKVAKELMVNQVKVSREEKKILCKMRSYMT